MSGVLNAFGSFLAAAIGWIALEFVARPFRKFFDLRGEIIRLSVQTANIPAQYREPRSTDDNPEIFQLSEDETKRLQAAVATFRDVAAQMTAFAENETYALKLTRILGYNPIAASQALMGISNTRHLYGQSRKYHLDNLAKALKFRSGIA